MKTSRERLYDYIQAQRAVSVEDLSRALHMTEANARYHLGILQQQGLVAVIGKRGRKSRGRPAPLYGVSEQALGHNLDGLASAMLSTLLQGKTVAEQKAILEDLAQQLVEGGSYQGNNPEVQQAVNRISGAAGMSPGLSRRLLQAVRFMNSRHYRARWEAHAQSPRVILGHCPYAAIINEHPEVCRLDEALLAALLGEPVQQRAKLAPDLHGASYCMFTIQRRQGRQEPG